MCGDVFARLLVRYSHPPTLPPSPSRQNSSPEAVEAAPVLGLVHVLEVAGDGHDDDGEDEHRGREHPQHAQVCEKVELDSRKE